MPQKIDVTKPGYRENLSENLVGFKVGEEEFAIDIMDVHEIHRMMPITKIPNLPHFIEGVISLRGNIVPIIFLRKRLGLPMDEPGDKSRIVIAEIGENIVGLVVDQVTAVINLSAENIKPPTPLMTQVKQKYVIGVGQLGERLIIILHLNEILSSEERDIMSRIEYEKEL